MGQEEIVKKIDDQAEKINAIYDSVEKTRKYFLVIVWITVIAFVLPLIGLMFAVPSLMSSYSTLLSI